MPRTVATQALAFNKRWLTTVVVLVVIGMVSLVNFFSTRPFDEGSNQTQLQEQAKKWSNSHEPSPAPVPSKGSTSSSWSSDLPSVGHASAGEDTQSGEEEDEDAKRKAILKEQQAAELELEEAETYTGPPLTMEIVHKKMAKLLWGDIVVHEEENEKNLKVPLQLMYEELYKHANTILDKTWEAGKYGDAGPHLRTYSQLYTLVFDRPELHIRLARSPRFAAAGYIVNQLEQKLFPWIKKKYHSLNELRSTWKGKGIVLTSGKWHFPLALHAILCLRNVLNVTLPIEVFHSGPGDTETKFSKALERIPNVRAVDVNTIFEESQAGLGGWHVKPFSMLASSFEEMVFLDADVLFLQDPATLFSYKGYKNLGTVFFYDRSIGHGRYETHEWFEGWMKDPTPIARQSRFLQHNTIHEMESGVVVFDKHRALMQLLGVCWMNTREQREVAMKKVHGDKETFWMVAELMRLPYYWVPGYGGTIGYKNKTDGYICGGLYHADENGRPLWWNGGVLMNKHYHRDEYIEFTHWAYDKTTEVTWKWETEHTPFCLMPKNPETEIGILDIRERDVTSKFLEHYKYIQDRGMDRLDEIMKHFGY